MSRLLWIHLLLLLTIKLSVMTITFASATAITTKIYFDSSWVKETSKQEPPRPSSLSLFSIRKKRSSSSKVQPKSPFQGLPFSLTTNKEICIEGGDESTASTTAASENPLDEEDNECSHLTTRIGEVVNAFESVLIPVVPQQHQKAQKQSEVANHNENNQGIDAQLLVQACRTYASYVRSIGQSFAAKEIEKNADKAAVLLKVVIDQQQQQNCNTLRSVLDYEKRTLGLHGPGGMLEDPSGAVGFLWMRRSLAYQYRFSKLVLELPSTTIAANTSDHDDMNDGNSDDGPSTVAAALKAYGLELEPYHAWPLRRINYLFLSSSLPVRRLLASAGGFEYQNTTKNNFFGPREESATRRDLHRLIDLLKPTLSEWKQIYADLDLEDVRRH